MTACACLWSAAAAGEAIETFPWPRPLPEASADALPRWRGFNVQYKFHRDESNIWIQPGPGGVVERDFRMIAELGFNFVRVPLDYRIWTLDGDREKFDEGALEEIDRIVALGRKHGLHVCLNFHRAPGWTVHHPKEPTSLWTDAETRRICALHWAAFARRHRGIPGRELSFNLVNEPGDTDPDTYFEVMRQLVEAIRAEDPQRLIIVDGSNYGSAPDARFRKLRVAMAARGYQPYGVSHYKAEWMEGMDHAPAPAWPGQFVSGFLAGPAKLALQKPLELRGPFGGKTIRLRVGTVSRLSRLAMTDGRGRPIWERRLEATDGGREFSIAVPVGANSLRLSNVEGDWTMLLSLALPDAELIFNPSWGVFEAGPVTFDPDDAQHPFRPAREQNQAWLAASFEPWTRLPDLGIGVMVGEFGAYRHTPHHVVLAWMKDLLEICEQAGFGWALWEFRGPFGVLDSRRTDVEYVSWNGHRLDREMLEILQKH